MSAYEMLRGHRPFIMEKNMTTSAIYNLLMHTRPSASVNWDNYTCDVLKMVSFIIAGSVSLTNNYGFAGGVMSRVQTDCYPLPLSFPT